MPIASTESGRKAKNTPLKIGVGVFVLFALVIAIAGSVNGSSSEEASSTPSPTVSTLDTTPSETPTPTPTVTHNRYSASQYAKAKVHMRVKNDSVALTKFYQDVSSPIYVTQNGFFAYINASTPSSPRLRLEIQYFASDWLFVESYTINVDGVIYTLSPSYGEVETDNGIIGGESMIWEWYDFVPTSDDIAMLEAIAKSKKTVIRSNGKQYYDDRTITFSEKSALTNVLIMYDALSNDIKSV
jgi:hypothetical protein